MNFYFKIDLADAKLRIQNRFTSRTKYIATFFVEIIIFFSFCKCEAHR